MRSRNSLFILLVVLFGQMSTELTLKAWDFIELSSYGNDSVYSGLASLKPGEDLLAEQFQTLKSAGPASFNDVTVIFQLNTSLAALPRLNDSGRTVKHKPGSFNPEYVNETGSSTVNSPIEFSANQSSWLVIDTRTVSFEWSGVTIVMPVDVAESIIAATPLQIQNSRANQSGKQIEAVCEKQIQAFAIYDFPEPSTSRLGTVSAVVLTFQFREKRKRSILIKVRRGIKRDQRVSK